MANNRNELTNATHSGTLTVAGLASQPGANLDHVAVSGTGLSAGNANVYADGSWARAGATLASGTNSYTATAEDTHGRTAQDSVTVNLPATVTFTYDANGNLTGDGRRVFEYDYENQLTNVNVASAWRESMKYDAFGRKRVLQQHQWTGSAWLLTNEVRYVYDGMLVVQERHFQPQVSTNIPINTISYTRGRDLSGSLQGAGGIGGPLARSEMSNLESPHAYYHADGNGNITALVNTNGAVVARYQYDPYGNLLGMAGPLAEANTYRFSSKEWHANAGLYYYGFRYYEPNLQRWLNRDPIGEWGGWNLYRFVRNDPVNRIDAEGLEDFLLCDLQTDFNSPGWREGYREALQTIGDLYQRYSDWAANNREQFQQDYPTLARFLEAAEEFGPYCGGMRAPNFGRGWGRGPGSTPNPFKHMRAHPTDPGKVIFKDPRTGKTIIKPKPPGFPEPKPQPPKPQPPEANK